MHAKRTFDITTIVSEEKTPGDCEGQNCLLFMRVLLFLDTCK